MSKKNFLAVALLSALALPALAQTTSTASTTAGAQVGDVSTSTTLVLPAAPADSRTEVHQSGSLKTTGQAFLPGMSVSSGGFNCAGTSGVAIGVTGFAGSAGTTTEQNGCMALNAAVLYGQKGDAEMFNAVMCELPPVKAARKKLGYDCDTLKPIPKTNTSAAPAADKAVTADNTNDEVIRRRLSHQ